VLVPFAAAALLAIFNWWIPAAAFLLLCLFMAYFFRDPKRTIPTERASLFRLRTGGVTRIEETADGKLVSVFLSPLDVHINRSPIAVPSPVSNIPRVGNYRPQTTTRALSMNAIPCLSNPPK